MSINARTNVWIVVRTTIAFVFSWCAIEEKPIATDIMSVIGRIISESNASVLGSVSGYNEYKRSDEVIIQNASQSSGDHNKTFLIFMLKV